MVDFITPAIIDIRANDAVASNTVGGNGQMLFNTTSNSLYVYDGVLVGGYKTELTAYVGPQTYQASNFGYVSGGGPGLVSTIQKYSLSSDAPGENVALLTQGRNYGSGQSSTTYGYTSGGDYAGNYDTIDKFPFASDTNAVDVGEISQARSAAGGQTAVNEQIGYASGGGLYPFVTGRIDTILFSSDVSGSWLSTLSQDKDRVAGQSSETHGYASGGFSPTSYTDRIDKFPFTSSADATDIAELAFGYRGAAGQNSDTHGYVSGGQGDPGINSNIYKFTFSSDTPASLVGNLAYVRTDGAGHSSYTHGYTACKSPSENGVIDKFPFSSDASAIDVAEMWQGNLSMATAVQQY